MTPADPRRHSPAAERNRGPILAELRRLLPSSGTALEVASGTGQHAVHFAAALPGWIWLPSDPDASACASIAAWAAAATLPNLRAPRRLDVVAARWPVDEPVDAVFCANLLHIAPWATCAALMAGAARHLPAQGLLVTYGPYLVRGEPVAPGNEAFDTDLRARNPTWGLRWLHDVMGEAARAGFTLEASIAMPANNRMLVFRRAAA